LGDDARGLRGPRLYGAAAEIRRSRNLCIGTLPPSDGPAGRLNPSIANVVVPTAQRMRGGQKRDQLALAMRSRLGEDPREIGAP
jgi:hypothetical protein